MYNQLSSAVAADMYLRGTGAVQTGVVRRNVAKLRRTVPTLGAVRSKEFYLLDVPLNCVGLVDGPLVTDRILGQADKGLKPNCGPMVVDVNQKRIGETRLGYVPQVVILAGHDAFRWARIRGDVSARMWVGSLAAARLGLLHADHQFGASKLREKLQQALELKYGVSQNNSPGVDMSRPWIIEVYPFE